MRAAIIFAVLASAACVYGQQWKEIHAAINVKGLDIRGLAAAPLEMHDTLQSLQSALVNSLQIDGATVVINDIKDATIPRKGSAFFWNTLEDRLAMGLQIQLDWRMYDRPAAVVEFTVSGVDDFNLFRQQFVRALRRQILRKKVKGFFPEIESVTRAQGKPLSGPACLGMCGASNPMQEKGIDRVCTCDNTCEEMGDCCPSYHWVCKTD